MSNIKSNKLITDEQVLSFFRSLNLVQAKSCEITTWLNHVGRDTNGNISLSTFTDFVLRDLTMIYPLYTIKTRLIEIVIGENDFSYIVQRQKYYNDKIKDPTTKPPAESCFSKMSRFITHKPPLLYHNYKPQNDASIDLALYYLRTKFGYSVRPHRVSSASISLSMTKRSLKNEGSSYNINSHVHVANTRNYKFSSHNLQYNISLTKGTTVSTITATTNAASPTGDAASTTTPTANTLNQVSSVTVAGKSNRSSNIVIPKKSVFEATSNRHLNSVEVKCKPC